MSPRYKPPTIAEEGLKARTARYGVDYDKLVWLLDSEEKNAPIARILSKGRAHKLDVRTVSRWRKQYQIEKTGDN